MRSADLVLIAATVFAVPSLARAGADDDAEDDDEIDVAAFEYVDVIETVEGSILRGVVTEQTPNVKYKLATADGSVHVIHAANVVKISKQRNPRYRDRARARSRKRDRDRGAVASAADLPAVDDTESVTASARVAAPAAGLRISPELAVVVPAGDLVGISGSPLSYRTSFAPGVAVGYEHYRGNLGLTVGALARYTAWRMPVQIAALGSHSTLETHVFGRAALQLGRAMPYAGLAVGADTNHTKNDTNGVTSTAVGLGVNLMAGVAIAASRAAVIDLGLDYHPGTDTIEAGWDASVSYLALRFGATVRL